MSAWLGNPCRLCLCGGSLNTIPDDPHYLNAIFDASGVKVSPTDELPHNLCDECFSFINKSRIFRKESQENNNTLLDMIKKSNKYLNIEKENLMKNLLILPNADDFGETPDIHTIENINMQEVYNIENFHEENNTNEVENLGVENEDLSSDNEDLKWDNKGKAKHGNKIAKCHICNKEMLSTSIGEHMKRHQLYGQLLKKGSKVRNKRPLAECDTCGKRMLKKRLLAHFLTHDGSPGKLICKHCGKSFERPFALLRHCRAKHGYERVDKCSYCDFMGCTEYEVRVHEKLHTSDDLLTCEICGKRIKWKNAWVQHMAEHGDAKILCSECPETFRSTRQLARHKSQKHKPLSNIIALQVNDPDLSLSNVRIKELSNTDPNTVEKLQVDSKIDTYFNAMGEVLNEESVSLRLQSQKAIARASQTNNNTKTDSTAYKKDLTIDNKQDMINKRNKVNIDKENLMTNLLILPNADDYTETTIENTNMQEVYNIENFPEESNSNEIENLGVKKKDLSPDNEDLKWDNKGKAKHVKKKAKCHICNKEMLSRSIGKHMKRHQLYGKLLKKGSKVRNKRPLAECDTCGKRMLKKRLLAHFLTHDGSPGILICKHCNKSFDRPFALLRHCRAKHGYERVDKCSFCDFMGCTEYEVRVHEKLHTSDDLLTCEICGKSFKWKNAWVQHMAEHGDAKILCSECPETFRSTRQLARHKSQKHKPLSKIIALQVNDPDLSLSNVRIKELSNTDPNTVEKLQVDSKIDTYFNAMGEVLNEKSVSSRLQSQKAIARASQTNNNTKTDSTDYKKDLNIDNKQDMINKRNKLNIDKENLMTNLLILPNADDYRETTIENTNMQEVYNIENFHEESNSNEIENLGVKKKDLSPDNEDLKWDNKGKAKHVNKKAKCDICNKEMLSRSIGKHMKRHQLYGKLLKKGSKVRNKRPLAECDTCGKRMLKKRLLAHFLIHDGSPGRLICKHCGKSFDRPFALLRHCRAKHGYERVDKCSYCDFMGCTEYEVRVHEKLHTSDDPLTCEICGKSFKWKNVWSQHMAEHGDANILCSECPEIFQSTRQLARHKSQKHKPLSSIIRKFQCPHCPHSALHKRTIQIHMMKKHETNNMQDITQVYKSLSTEECIKNNTKNYKNSSEKVNVKRLRGDKIKTKAIKIEYKNGGKVNFLSAFHRHLDGDNSSWQVNDPDLSLNNVKVEELSNTVPNTVEELQDDSKIDTYFDAMDDVLNEESVSSQLESQKAIARASQTNNNTETDSTAYKKDLTIDNKHVKLVDLKTNKDLQVRNVDLKMDKDLTVDNVCGKVDPASAKGKSTPMKKHFYLHAGQGKIIMCEHCGKKYDRPSRLRRHYRASHGYEKTDQCLYCDFRGSSRGDVTLHERKHTGLKPYSCQHCEETFRYSSSRQRHLLEKHGEARVVQCEECALTFLTPRLLSSHKYEKHRPLQYSYQCALCLKVFKRRGAARGHLLRHHNEAKSFDKIVKLKLVS